MNEDIYDLVIVGGGCMGAAVAYHARKNNKKAVLIEKQKIGSADRYWSSSFSARQNRVQYTEKYLSNYVLESNKYWDELEVESGKKFRHTEGALWFGDREIRISEGNIFDSNNVLTELGVDKLYMQSLIPTQPKFFQNFRMDGSNKDLWSNWGALFQQDGGSINLEESYNYFLNKAQDATDNLNLVIKNEATIKTYTKCDSVHIFTLQSGEVIKGKKVFIGVGIDTPTFMNDTMNAGDHLIGESTIYEYLASYFEIIGDTSQFEETNFPNWIQFLDEDFQMGYGFPYHSWDSPIPNKNTIKIGTMASAPVPADPNAPILPTDPRVIAVEKYVKNYMKNLNETAEKHYRCPIVFYNGRQTILDYANRTQTDIVVQNGGWIGKYYPLLARTAYEMLFEPDKIYHPTTDHYMIVKDFLNRTSYPIRNQVVNYFSSQPAISEDIYDTVIVGAGVSGLYSAYRINSNSATSNERIAVFDMLDRIAGRLWSIKFEGASTPMQLGGMRYIEQNHKLLAHYVKALKIPELDFHMTGNALQDYSLKAYLRNDRYRQNEWTDLQKEGQRLYTAYRIYDELIGMTASQMISYSCYQIFKAKYNATALANLDTYRGVKNYAQDRILKIDQFNYEIKFDLEDWNFLKKQLSYQPKNSHKTYPLYKFGFQNVIEDMFSHEAYNFISEQNGYFSNTSNASYMEQACTYVLDFGNVKYKTLEGGFDMFCYTFANEILDPEIGIGRNNGGLYLQQELIDVTKANDVYTLMFKHTKTGDLSKVKAKKIIFGMPRRSVEILYNKINLLKKDLTNYQNPAPGDFLIDAIRPKNLQELIFSTQNMPAIKIIMNFTQNWWDVGKLPEFRTSEQMRGVSATDLPIRQALYFGTNVDNMLLASYNDMITTQYWSVLQDNFDEFHPNIHKKKKCDKSISPCVLKRERVENIAPASERLVHDVLKQLSLLHGKKVSIDTVKEAMYQNWGNDPFGGGYHNWFSGYDVEKVMKAVRRPWKEENIFIVGEAFSNLTGWVEGALQTTEHMLKDEYGIPYTLPNDYIGY